MAKKFDFDPLADNPQRRVPVCLCLDTSGSMRGAPIAELNEGIRVFFESIKEDSIARDAADICIVTFGGDKPALIANFAGVDMQNIPTIKAGGGTPLGTAINLSLDCIENRKKEYKQKGVQYYQPWLVVMSDGRPGSEKQREMARAKLRTEELTQNRKLVLLSIGIGDKADMEFMKALSKSCGRLKDMRFRDFFIWLSQSVTSTSHSNAAMIAIERPSGAFFEAY